MKIVSLESLLEKCPHGFNRKVDCSICILEVKPFFEPEEFELLKQDVNSKKKDFEVSKRLTNLKGYEFNIKRREALLKKLESLSEGSAEAESSLETIK